MRTLSATSLAIVIANILAHTSPAGAQATFPERVRNCEGQACVLQWPRLCPPAPPVSQLCTTFDPPLLVGTQYGYSAGNPPGSVVFSSGGADASVELFELFSGVTTFGETKVDKPPLPFGSSQVLDINNINLEFDFAANPVQPREIQLEFLNLGGIQNLAINGSAIYVGRLSTAPAILGGATVSVFSAPVAGGTSGVLLIRGAIYSLLIGGQEFWIDNVCASS